VREAIAMFYFTEAHRFVFLVKQFPAPATLLVWESNSATLCIKIPTLAYFNYSTRMRLDHRFLEETSKASLVLTLVDDPLSTNKCKGFCRTIFAKRRKR